MEFGDSLEVLEFWDVWNVNLYNVAVCFWSSLNRAEEPTDITCGTINHGSNN